MVARVLRILVLPLVLLLASVASAQLATFYRPPIDSIEIQASEAETIVVGTAERVGQGRPGLTTTTTVRVVEVLKGAPRETLTFVPDDVHAATGVGRRIGLACSAS